MKQELKTGKTKQKIIRAAIVEFGEKGYDNASISSMCRENNISKGLIYYNFNSRDGLYIACVEECSHRLKNFLSRRNKACMKNSITQQWQNMIEARQEYFKKNPLEETLFFEPLIHPPGHLIKQLTEAQREYDVYLQEFFRSIIQKTKLRDGVDEKKAIDYCLLYQKMYNSYYILAKEGNGKEIFIKEHEEQLVQMLDYILYGIAEEQMHP